MTRKGENLNRPLLAAPGVAGRVGGPVLDQESQERAQQFGDLLGGSGAEPVAVRCPAVQNGYSDRSSPAGALPAWPASVNSAYPWA